MTAWWSLHLTSSLQRLMNTDSSTTPSKIVSLIKWRLSDPKLCPHHWRSRSMHKWFLSFLPGNEISEFECFLLLASILFRKHELVINSSERCLNENLRSCYRHLYNRFPFWKFFISVEFRSYTCGRKKLLTIDKKKKVPHELERVNAGTYKRTYQVGWINSSFTAKLKNVENSSLLKRQNANLKKACPVGTCMRKYFTLHARFFFLSFDL